MMSLSESLKAGVPFLAVGAAALASSRSLTRASVPTFRGEVEMRDRLLGLDQPRGDGRAHVVERHLLVAAGLVERRHLSHDLLCREARGRRGARALCRRGEVAREDAPVRA